MSTKSGRAPAWLIASVVAMNVCGTVTTMSPGCTPSRRQRESHCVGAAGDSHAVFGVAKRREFLFEFFDHRTAHKTRGLQHFLENRP